MAEGVVAIGREAGSEKGENVHVAAPAQGVGHHVEKHGVGVLEAHHVFHIVTLWQKHLRYALDAIVDGANEQRKAQRLHENSVEMRGARQVGAEKSVGRPGCGDVSPAGSRREIS